MAQKFSKNFYNSKEWQTVRESVLKRDKYLCRVCFKPAEEVHHIRKLTPYNINNIEISLNSDNLISLCRDCHFEQHKQDKQQGQLKRKKQDECDSKYKFNSDGELEKIHFKN